MHDSGISPAGGVRTDLSELRRLTEPGGLHLQLIVTKVPTSLPTSVRRLAAVRGRKLMYSMHLYVIYNVKYKYEAAIWHSMSKSTNKIKLVVVVGCVLVHGACVTALFLVFLFCLYLVSCISHISEVSVLGFSFTRVLLWHSAAQNRAGGSPKCRCQRSKCS